MPDRQLHHRLDDLPDRTREVVTGLRDGLLTLFGADFAAMWLYGGSLFSRTALDIDLHILLRREPAPDQFAAIIQLQEAVSHDQRWVDEIDCWYIRLDDARKPEPPRDLRHVDFRDQHWALHRAHWLAGACIVVHGLAPSAVVQPPSWPELKETLRAEANDTEATQANSAYWTLQLCRVLASLETGDVVRSKGASGAWALTRLPAESHPAIRTAMRVYSGEAPPEAFSLPEEDYQCFYRLIRPLLDAALEA